MTNNTIRVRITQDELGNLDIQRDNQYDAAGLFTGSIGLILIGLILL